MTWTPVGSFIQQSAATFSLTPVGGGDLVLLAVENPDTAVWCTGASSSNATWAQMGTKFTGSSNTRSIAIFGGTVTSTSAQTVTLSFNGTPTNVRAAGGEFSSSVGSWALDGSQGNLDGGGTATWPSLTPSGSGELYFGFGIDSGSAVSGSTSGYTYNTTAQGNGAAWNPNVSAASAPVWGDSAMVFGMVILVKETAAGAAAGAPQPYVVPSPAAIQAASW